MILTPIHCPGISNFSEESQFHAYNIVGKYPQGKYSISTDKFQSDIVIFILNHQCLLIFSALCHIPSGYEIRYFDWGMVSPEMFIWFHLINPVTIDCTGGSIIVGNTQCLLNTRKPSGRRPTDQATLKWNNESLKVKKHRRLKTLPSHKLRMQITRKKQWN